MTTDEQRITVGELALSLGISLPWMSYAPSEMIQSNRKLLAIIAIFCGGIVNDYFCNDWMANFISESGRDHFDFLVQRWLGDSQELDWHDPTGDGIPF